MDILTEIIDDYGIDEIFCSPKDYVDDSYDRPIVKIWRDGKELFTILIGTDNNEVFYLVAEDDEVAEDYYPHAGETLWEVYERIIEDWTHE